MLHSGSRHIGSVLAEHHIGIAQRLNHNQALADPDLAVFLAGTPSFEAYRHDLGWAQDYALFNRRLLLHLLPTCASRPRGSSAVRITACSTRLAWTTNGLSSRTTRGAQAQSPPQAPAGSQRASRTGPRSVASVAAVPARTEARESEPGPGCNISR
jgi:hypothetical protein